MFGLENAPEIKSMITQIAIGKMALEFNVLEPFCYFYDIFL